MGLGSGAGRIPSALRSMLTGSSAIAIDAFGAACGTGIVVASNKEKLGVVDPRQ